MNNSGLTAAIISSLLFAGIGCALADQAGVSHSDMKIYKFTSDFISCVKSNRPTYSSDSAVESSVMGGDTILSGKPLDDDYWQYMTCLNKTGTSLSNTAVDTSSACDGGWLSVNHKIIQIPPGVEGKSFVVNTVRYTCTNGEWTGDVGEFSNSPDRNSATCPLKQLNYGACQFSAPAGIEGDIRMLRNIFSESDDGVFYDGTANVACGQQGWEFAGAPVCLPQQCQSTQVSWSGNDGSVCTGVVGSDGFVEQQPKDTVYRPTLDLAIFDSKIVIGTAQMACKSGSWYPVSAECKKKAHDQLVCKNRINDAGVIEFYCL